MQTISFQKLRPLVKINCNRDGIKSIGTEEDDN